MKNLIQKPAYLQQLRNLSEPPRWRRPLIGTETDIRVFNCSARREVPLVIRNENCVTWYTCGPTVYDATHLGHASCYVKLDIIQRVLRDHFHYNLVTAMNITDIDDKIIKKSQETSKSWQEIARFYEIEFWKDMKKLNVQEPNMKVRVSENIPKITKFIKRLIDRKVAYIGKDNSVYFHVQVYPSYGKLQRVISDNTPIDETKKESSSKLAPADFALWKAKKTPEEPSWPSFWGDGRPGWHIECSVLASMLFGSSIDFHAGGLDLRFPHHENEEAQSCVYHETMQWVNYWLHTGKLSMKGERDKMSKSLKNTVSVDEMLAKYTPDDFRMACLLSNYKNPMEYGDDMMSTARNTLSKFKAFRSDCNAYLTGKKPAVNMDTDAIMKNLNYAKSQVDISLKNDFDTAYAVGIMTDIMSLVSRSINSKHGSDDSDDLKVGSSVNTVAAVDNFVQQTMTIFGLTYASNMKTQMLEPEIDLNGLLQDLLQSRSIIRDRAATSKNKDLFQICDDIRNCLRQHGVEIKDHTHGTSWSFIKK